MAGREPANLLRGPQDPIYLVSWDGGLPSLTTSTDGVHFSTQAILAAPRGGTSPSNIVDGVFQSGSGDWVYIRIELP